MLAPFQSKKKIKDTLTVNVGGLVFFLLMYRRHIGTGFLPLLLWKSYEEINSFFLTESLFIMFGAH